MDDLQVKAHAAGVALKKKNSFGARLFKSRILLLMCTPAILFFLVFAYIPMPGAYVAFVNYVFSRGIFGSQFVGFENFRFLLLSGDLVRLTANTILYNLAFIFIGNIVQIFIALLLNELASKWFKKLSQAIMFFPHFISYVLIGLFAYSILNYDYGLLNKFLQSVGLAPLEVYSMPAAWPFIIIFTALWQGTGYGSIIYFAAIMGIESEILEAATIDGANRLQRIRFVLLPCLKPTFIILVLFSLGGIMRGNFGLFYNLVGTSNSLLFKTTDIIDTYVFRSLTHENNFSISSAAGLYQSVIGFVFVVTANWLVKKIEPEYSLF